MKFTVAYRGADGARREETMEAANRAACIAACRARGIAPLSVREGAAPRQTGGGARSSGGLGAKGIVLGALGVLAVLGVLWMILGGREEVRPPKPKAPTVRPPKPPSVAVTNAVPAPRPKENAKKKPEAAPQPAASVRAAPDAVTVAAGADTNDVETVAATNKPVFATHEEEVLHMIASVVPGDAPPPIPNLPHFHDIRKMLETTIVIEKDDSEDTAFAKESVARMKEHLERYLDAGGDADEFVSAYRDFLMESHRTHTMYEKMVKDTLRDEGRAAAAAALKEVNARLAEKGICPVKIKQRLWDAAAD